MTAIAVDRLTKRFGDVLAVDDLSFSVSDGEHLRGKTTTLRTLLGSPARRRGPRRSPVARTPLQRLFHHVGAALERSDDVDDDGR